MTDLLLRVWFWLSDYFRIPAADDEFADTEQLEGDDPYTDDDTPYCHHLVTCEDDGRAVVLCAAQSEGAAVGFLAERAHAYELAGWRVVRHDRRSCTVRQSYADGAIELELRVVDLQQRQPSALRRWN